MKLIKFQGHASDRNRMTNAKTFFIFDVNFSYKKFFLCQMIAEDPDKFKALVQESLRRQVAAINSLADVGKLIFHFILVIF